MTQKEAESVTGKLRRLVLPLLSSYITLRSRNIRARLLYRQTLQIPVEFGIRDVDTFRVQNFCLSGCR